MSLPAQLAVCRRARPSSRTAANASGVTTLPWLPPNVCPAFWLSKNSSPRMTRSSSLRKLPKRWPRLLALGVVDCFVGVLADILGNVTACTVVGHDGNQQRDDAENQRQ